MTAPKKPVPARKRKEAAKVLGIAIHQRYENLVNAVGEDALVVATTDLAQCMYENVEFVIWALKSMGGLNPPAPEEIRPVKLTKAALLGNPDLPVLPALLSAPAPVPVIPMACQCPPLEPGIIGNRHMTSCPEFVPS